MTSPRPVPAVSPGRSTRPSRQAQKPITSAPCAQQLAGRPGVVLARFAAQVRPGGVHEPVGGQLQRLLAGALPPAQRDRRVEQAERGLQQRQGRIAAGHHQGRAAAARSAGPGGARRRPAAAVPAGAGPRAGWPAPAAGHEAGPACRGAGQRQRDEAIADRRQRDPGAVVAQRGHRPRVNRRRRHLARPEQLLDRQCRAPAPGPARPAATGLSAPASTADTACRDTPAIPASCCWEKPRACRASRSRMPLGVGRSAAACLAAALRRGQHRDMSRRTCWRGRRRHGGAVGPEARRVERRDHKLAHRPVAGPAGGRSLPRPLTRSIGLPAGPGGPARRRPAPASTSAAVRVAPRRRPAPDESRPPTGAAPGGRSATGTKPR